jgi:signal transduction histidine kinase
MCDSTRLLVGIRCRSEFGVHYGPVRDTSLARRLPVVVALALVALGVIATAARLDTPADASVLRFGWATWQTGGVVVDIPGGSTGLRTGDEVTAIAGHRLADGLGTVPEPRPGDTLVYEVSPGIARAVPIARPGVYPLLRDGWGDLVFVVVLAILAVALYLRRPDEPATTPLLLLAAGLFGSTLTVVAGLPALALATGGPLPWLFHANVIGVYSAGWGALIATSLRLVPDHPWLRRRRLVLGAAYAGPLGLMLVWAGVLLLAVPDPLRRFGLLDAAQTGFAAVALAVAVVAGVVGYLRTTGPVPRARLRWVGGGGIVAGAVGLAGWALPELVTGGHPLPAGAFGLSGLPFVAGIAVALRRHRLFDIERLVNRSLVYAAVLAMLVAGYAATVVLLVAGLRLSNAVAAALAAAVAAIALAPVRGSVQRVVNRLMYGERDDPAGVLDRLGGRLQAVMLPDDVSPAVVDTVARSLRVPYAALELADAAGGFRIAATHGVPVGQVHTEPLRHYGEPIGRLSVSDRGPADSLDPVDLALIRSLAQHVGPAVQAVRLYHDLVRSRAEVVALREDERRQVRRELHDGLGPSLASIALKAGLAAREVPAGPARDLLGEISTEVRTSLADVRRVVEALRPPALDELGLVGAVRSRATALSGELAIDVSGPTDRPLLPAAVETAAYRIAVEAMTNAARHSGGQHCAVAIECEDEHVVVDVRDDGQGLTADRPPGVGLRSMRERATELGGEWRIGALADGGTQVYARLPRGVGAV